MKASAGLGVDAEVLLSISEMTRSQLELIADFNRNSAPELVGFYYLCRDFPRSYIDKLSELMFPSWYTACFVEAPTNAAMWGVYGDGHRGACLQFRTEMNEQGKPTLALSGNLGGLQDGTASHMSHLRLVFEPVRYADDYPEINFFTMLGRLSRTKLSAFWYSGEGGATSAIGQRFLSESSQWRRDYWAIYLQANTTKLPHWAHEAERRLVLTGTLDDRRAGESRTLKYRTEDLAGIVFGMKASHADKLAIMNVIDNKLSAEQRRQFTFYQARFSYTERRLEHVPLRLLGPQV